MPNESADDAQTDGVERERWINDVLKDRLAAQLQSFERMDTKASVLLGFLTLAAPFLAQRNSTAHETLMWSSFSCFAVAGLFAVAVIAPRKLQVPPHPATFVSDVRRTTSLQMRLKQLADERVTAFQKNQERAGNKGLYWFASLVMFIVGSCLATLSLIIGR